MPRRRKKQKKKFLVARLVFAVQDNQYFRFVSAAQLGEDVWEGEHDVERGLLLPLVVARWAGMWRRWRGWTTTTTRRRRRGLSVVHVGAPVFDFSHSDSVGLALDSLHTKVAYTIVASWVMCGLVRLLTESVTAWTLSRPPSCKNELEKHAQVL